MSHARKWPMVLWLLIGILGLVFWWMVFFYAPREREMGDLQRIFYMHLPLAWVALLSFLISAAMHVLFLIRSRLKWLALGWATSHIGVVASTLVMITGMFWAKPAWGSWWPWEPRLTATFLMFMMYVAYLVLYHTMAQEGRFRIVAIYNILCAINIPVVYLAPRLWRSLHPVVIEGARVQLDAAMWHTVLVGWIWLSGVAAFWIWIAAWSEGRRLRHRMAIWSHGGMA